MSLVQLKDVTLVCLYGDDNAELSLRAIDICTSKCAFGGVLAQHWPNIKTKADYDVAFTRDFPAGVIDTSHILVIQYDGYILDATAWHDEWLKLDYIGAVWHWLPQGLRVGNGGFSLRSIELMKTVRYLSRLWNVDYWDKPDADDIIICQILRDQLSRMGYKFATESVARQFSFEREQPKGHSTFGFHGLFNFPYAMTVDEFYASVDPKLAPYVKRSREYGEVLDNYMTTVTRIA